MGCYEENASEVEREVIIDRGEDVETEGGSKE